MGFTGVTTFKTSSPRLVMLIVCTGIFLTSLNQTVVYGALPNMMNSLRVPVTQLDQAAWIVIGYLLGYTIAMPLLGKVSDNYGHGRVYFAAMLIFIAGSIMVALSRSLNLIIAARIIQAIGGGAVLPIAMAVAGDLYSGSNRAVAIGVIGAAAEAGGAFGPFYGAVVAQFLGWPWIFWINIPLSLIIAGIVFMNPGPRPQGKGKTDYLGGLLLAAGLAFFSIGVSRQTTQPYYLAYLLGFIFVALVFFVLFALRIMRSPEPIIEISMFRSRTFTASNVTNLLVGGALIIAMVNIPLMSDTILGASALEGGLRLLRFTIVLSLGAVAGGFLCKRIGYRVTTILGLVLAGAGFFLLSRWNLTIADPLMTIDLAICGLGFGLVISPLGTAAINTVREEQKGIASSMVVMMRMIGMIIGLSVITAWGMDQFHLMTAGLSLTEIIETPQKLTDSLLVLFDNFFLISGVVCLVAIIPALWVVEEKKKV